DYIIPKPLDPRVLLWVAPAEARAAMETGVARIQLDLDEYVERLEPRFGTSPEIRRIILHKAATDTKRVVFAEGERSRIIQAAAIVQREGIGRPILVGRPEVIRAKAQELGVPPELEIVEPSRHPRLEEYIQHYYQLRQRRGITLEEARQR